MIVVNLKGGLGNQMFQYACGRAVLLRCQSNGLNTELKLSTHSYTANPSRQYALAPYNIQAEVATQEETNSVKYPYGIFSKARRFFAGRFLKSFTTVHFDQDILTWRDNVFIDGYWQSEKYFSEFKQEIHSDFSLNECSTTANLLRKQIENYDTAVSVHVRRGDYVKHPNFDGICTSEYYKKACELIESNVQNPHFYVFSDDSQWVRDNLDLPVKTTFISNPELTDQEEIMLMSACAHNIIANSTFSWWGAWLNANPHKITIAPKKWARDEIIFKDIIPETWKRV